MKLNHLAEHHVASRRHFPCPILLWNHVLGVLRVEHNQDQCGLFQKFQRAIFLVFVPALLDSFAELHGKWSHWNKKKKVHLMPHSSDVKILTPLKFVPEILLLMIRMIFDF